MSHNTISTLIMTFSFLNIFSYQNEHMTKMNLLSSIQLQDKSR